jgi:hypothetical protein
MIGAIEKVWPHFIPTLQQKLTLPLVRDNTNLTGRLKCMSEQLDELKDKYKDLCNKNSWLIDQCKAKDKDLQDDEQEIPCLQAQLACYMGPNSETPMMNCPPKGEGKGEGSPYSPLSSPVASRKQGDIDGSRPATIPTV